MSCSVTQPLSNDMRKKKMTKIFSQYEYKAICTCPLLFSSPPLLPFPRFYFACFLWERKRVISESVHFLFIIISITIIALPPQWTEKAKSIRPCKVCHWLSLTLSPPSPFYCYVFYCHQSFLVLSLCRPFSRIKFAPFLQFFLQFRLERGERGRSEQNNFYYFHWWVFLFPLFSLCLFYCFNLNRFFFLLLLSRSPLLHFFYYSAPCKKKKTHDGPAWLPFQQYFTPPASCVILVAV